MIIVSFFFHKIKINNNINRINRIMYGINFACPENSFEAERQVGRRSNVQFVGRLFRLALFLKSKHSGSLSITIEPRDQFPHAT